MTLPLLLAARLLLGEADAGYVRERTSDGAHCLRWPVQAGASSATSFVQSSAGDFQLGPGLFDAVSRSEASWASQASACSSLVLLEGTRSPSRAVGYLQGGPTRTWCWSAPRTAPASSGRASRAGRVIPAGTSTIAGITGRRCSRSPC